MLSSRKADLRAQPCAGSRLPTLVKGVASGLVVAAGVNLVRLVDPNVAGHYPTCPFLALTGLVCPGCGSLRALHALTLGDVGTAWSMNPALLVALPFLVWSWAAWLWRSATGRTRTKPVSAGLLAMLTVLIGAFWVLRNVPGFEFLGPA